MSADVGSVLLLTGPPGSGKTTVADIVASRFDRSVHVEADRFFSFVVGGYVDPWDPDAHEQNAVVMEIASEVARRYAEAGYFTILEGVFIPGWFYEPTRERLRSASLEVASAILRLPLATMVARARPRTPPKGLGDEITGRAMYGFPVIKCHTSGPEPAACTRRSTSFSPTAGFSRSSNFRTSADPYSSCTIAFMRSPLHNHDSGAVCLAASVVRRIAARPPAESRSLVATVITRQDCRRENPEQAGFCNGFAALGDTGV